MNACNLIISICVGTVFEFGLLAKIPDNYTYDECSPDEKECDFWLTIQQLVTMELRGSAVYWENETLYTTNSTEVDFNEVVTADGFSRLVVTANGTIPGPPIVVYEHQILNIHVKNLMSSQSTTIHWHGMNQENTCFMDGVAWVTQCPIGPGQMFTYRFKAEPCGTYWYHSHIGAQRTDGLFGALIVKPRPTKDVKLQPTDVIMTIGDWYHQVSDRIYLQSFDKLSNWESTMGIDGGKFTPIPWISALIEGKGRTFDGNVMENHAPLSTYVVEHGKEYRFHIINHGMVYPLKVSVDDHTFYVVASDGYDVKPIEAHSVIVHPGERYDILLKPKAKIATYWIRVESIEVNLKNHYTLAVLRYKGAVFKYPKTKGNKCTGTKPCVVVNCPYKYTPHFYNTTCVIVTELENINEVPAPTFTETSSEHFLNFGFPGSEDRTAAINGRKFRFSGVNALTQDSAIGDGNCDRQECGGDKVCECQHEIFLPFNKTVQMVWVNLGMGAGWGHPIHLHGHSFQVLKLGLADVNKTTGKIFDVFGNPDIDCDDRAKYCSNAKWKNRTWTNGNVPGLNLKNPIKKDTLIVPTGGYAVVRIHTLNPGKWFMHCHIEIHALNGMAMILSVESDRLLDKIPIGFPKCSNFFNDPSRDQTAVNQPTDNHARFYTKGIFYGIICNVFILTFIAVVVFKRYGKGYKYQVIR